MLQSLLYTRKKNHTYNNQLLSGEQITDIYQIELSFPNGEQYYCNREKDGFRIHTQTGRYYLKTEMLTKLFSVLTKTRTGTIISHSKENEVQYGLTKKQGIHIALMNNRNETLLNLALGKKSLTGDRRFIEIKNTKLILQSEDDFKAFTAPKLTAWIQTQLFNNYFSEHHLQALQLNGTSIFRSNANTKAFDNFEKALEQLYALDIMPFPIPKNCTQLIVERGDQKHDTLMLQRQITNDIVIWINGSGYLLGHFPYQALEACLEKKTKQ